MKLLIGVPCMDYVHVDFIKCLYKLTDRLKKDRIDYTLCMESGTLVYLARDRICQKAIKEGFTHILWIDSDMVFEPEDFYKLRDSGKPFISGICVGRRKPHRSCLFKKLSPAERFTEYPSGVFEVAACGFAFLLIEVGIVERVTKFFQTGFLPLPAYGEDLAFCFRAKELDHKMYAHGDVRIGHIGHIAVYP